jgi:hypothetical protein
MQRAKPPALWDCRLVTSVASPCCDSACNPHLLLAPDFLSLSPSLSLLTHSSGVFSFLWRYMATSRRSSQGGGKSRRWSSGVRDDSSPSDALLQFCSLSILNVCVCVRVCAQTPAFHTCASFDFCYFSRSSRHEVAWGHARAWSERHAWRKRHA